MNRLPKVIIGQANYSARVDAWMSEQRRLDFGWVYVRSATDDHVRLTVTDVQVPIGVEPSNVAQGLPPARQRTSGCADVPVDSSPVTAPHVDLSHRPSRYVASAVIGDHELPHDG